MNRPDSTQLSQFVHYVRQRFDIHILAGSFTDSRPQPEIPSRALWLSMMLGEVAQVPSHLQLEAETRLPEWQRWVGYEDRISHDTFGYVSDRFDPAQLRQGARWINHKLKRGKAFESAKSHGLLVVSLDANEQFCSEHRCCEACLRRQVTGKNAAGQEVKITQYYHKQVYAQLSGPTFSSILDFEPMRQGEEECATALRLLRRIREQYGPRFFDLIVVDAWYTNGPFLRAVVEELGWPVVAVLKQECRDVYQEVEALTRGKAPTQVVEREHREVAIWDVRGLYFTDSYPGPVRAIKVRERWRERCRVGDRWELQERQQNWIWIVAGDLDGYEAGAVRDWGHCRWKVENNAFGELTQHWHLTHCAHHRAVALVVLLWIKIIAFTLFHAFAILHGKRFRMGKVTLNEMRKQVYRSLFCGGSILLFSG